MIYERYEGELKHYGVKGMKWGVKRRRKIVNASAEKASAYQRIANKNAKRYEEYANKIRRDKSSSKVDKEGSYKLNMAISKELIRKGKEYGQISKMYKTMNVSEMSRKDLRKAKRFLKEKMTLDLRTHRGKRKVTSFAPTSGPKIKGPYKDERYKKTERQKQWEDDYGINPHRPNGTKPRRKHAVTLNTIAKSLDKKHPIVSKGIEFVDRLFEISNTHGRKY